jgi:aspartate aminotransferase-like enzyme
MVLSAAFGLEHAIDTLARLDVATSTHIAAWGIQILASTVAPESPAVTHAVTG